MGRITTQVKITNFIDATKSVEINALVDTGASYLTLPGAWKNRLGDLRKIEDVEVETATGEIRAAEIYAAVSIKVANFREVVSEILFIDMEKSDDGEYEPLIGYLVLEAIPVAVDMLGHRLVKVRALDLK
ncbi:MAG TPA: retropepsin-like aspartic protease [Pyrinomonadaceae bacterium]|nr:retropepsin-like aspartic protease [Pyrinomonadaceae bacterium]